MHSACTKLCCGMAKFAPTLVLLVVAPLGGVGAQSSSDSRSTRVDRSADVVSPVGRTGHAEDGVDAGQEAHLGSGISSRFTGFVEANVFGYGRGVTRADDPVDAWVTLVASQELTFGRVRLLGAVQAEQSSAGEHDSWAFDPADRRPRRSPLSVRHAWVGLPLAPALDLQIGRFQVGWGRTDGFSPAEAFLPRDLSDPFDDERLPLWGARLQGERGPVRFELYHAFLTTPWRLPVMLGRFSPLWYADVFLKDAEGAPPRRGFDVGRVVVSGDQWDLGVWARTGIRPAPVLEALGDLERDPMVDLIVPLARRFAREDAYGVEAVRGQGEWLVRGEFSYSRSRDPEVGDAVLWAVGVERAVRSGVAVVTVAGSAIEPPINPLLLFDRAFVPSFVATTTQLEDWGSWEVTWLATFRRVGGILQLEASRDLTDVVKVTIGSDLPHGSRTSSPGAISRAKRLRAGLRWSW